ncbi:MAG: T9SS type A sorting domain-containing protein [Rhodothermales bacterium]|nr:T9SS type A sorting domain-containing protein [Rhodothermales bacterium]MBO6778062.1 T9SS type A sorting domain-containing protein [Rhodothermales bacterium]
MTRRCASRPATRAWPKSIAVWGFSRLFASLLVVAGSLQTVSGQAVHAANLGLFETSLTSEGVEAVDVSAAGVILGYASRGTAQFFNRGASGWEAGVELPQGGRGVAIGDSLAVLDEGRQCAQDCRDAVSVYRRTGGEWTLLATLRDPLPNGFFGYALDVWGEWVAVAGAQPDGKGIVYLYKATESTVVLDQTLVAPTPVASDGFAATISLSGGTLAVNSYHTFSTYVLRGDAWSFERAFFGAPVADIAPSGARLATVLNQSGGGVEVTVYVRSEAEWEVESKVVLEGSIFAAATTQMNDDFIAVPVVPVGQIFGNNELRLLSRHGGHWVQEGMVAVAAIPDDSTWDIALDSSRIVVGGSNFTNTSGGASVVESLPRSGHMAVDAVYPTSVGEGGVVTVSILGSGFTESTTVSLERGAQIWEPLRLRVSPTGNLLSIQLDTGGRFLDSWTVVASGAGSERASLVDGLHVVPLEAPVVLASYVGPPATTEGLNNATIQLTNSGNVDAILVPLRVGGFPEDAPPRLRGGVGDWFPSLPESDLVLDSTDAALATSLLIPRVPPGIPCLLDMEYVRPGTSDADVRLTLATSPPLVGVDPLSSSAGKGGRIGDACLKAGLLAALEEVASAYGGRIKMKCINEMIGHLSTLAGLGINVAGDSDAPIDYIKLLFETFKQALVCSGHALSGSTAIGLALSLSGSIGRGIEAIDKCLEDEWKEELQRPLDWPGPHSVPLPHRRSEDPNELRGPLGHGERRMVSAESVLSYTILFENLVSATAPARRVEISTILDPELFDLETFGFGTVSLADSTIAGDAWNRSSTSSLLDLRPAVDALVYLTSSLDETSGEVRWVMTALDPSTGSMTTNPLNGFLPPNHLPPGGEGAVSFSVRPRGELTTGSVLSASADIVFDSNPSIRTNQWSNVLDADPPVSMIESVQEADSSNYVVSWSGSDVGAGIASYSIYVSRDGNDFERWLRTSETNGVFHGDTLATYQFVSVASDLAGNMEEATFDSWTATARPPELPSSLGISLRSPFPNPALESVTVPFAVSHAGRVTLELYDTLGRRLVTVTEEEFYLPGNHEVSVDLEGLASGVYLILAKAGGHATTSMIVRR